MAGLTMLVWSLRSWPKAQYLARALGIPVDAWEFPFLLVPVGGPEVSVFEAMDRPNFGGLTERLKALTKPLAAAAYDDPWIKAELLADSKLAMAFHTGATVELVTELSRRDGYRVVTMAEALQARGDACAEDLHDEGLLDMHARWRRAWRVDGVKDEAILGETLKRGSWSTHLHSAAFFLASCPDWSPVAAHEQAADALAKLVLDDLEHPILARRLAKTSGFPPDVVERAQKQSALKR
jgi:hypothetical protein